MFEGNDFVDYVSIKLPTWVSKFSVALKANFY